MSKINYITVPTKNGDQSAELFARFTYEFAGGGSVRVIVTQLPGHPVTVSEESTRYRMGDIDAFQLIRAKGDYVIAAGLVLDALKRKHGVIKILNVIDLAPKYQEPEL